MLLTLIKILLIGKDFQLPLEETATVWKYFKKIIRTYLDISLLQGDNKTIWHNSNSPLHSNLKGVDDKSKQGHQKVKHHQAPKHFPMTLTLKFNRVHICSSWAICVASWIKIHSTICSLPSWPCSQVYFHIYCNDLDLWPWKSIELILLS